MHTINQHIMQNLLKQTEANGHFFGVTFIKKDGSIRNMNARFKSEGNANSVKHLLVYDMQKKGWRNIAKDKILSVRVYGIEAKVRA